jgi:hypothetical protein
VKALWLLAPALLGAPLAAQLAGGVQAVGYAVRQSTPADASAQTGAMAGAEGRLSLGRYSLFVRGLSGRLSGTGLARDVRLTGIALRRPVVSWLAVGVEAEAQRRESDRDIELWRLYGVGATVHAGLGNAGLRAAGEVAWFPLTAQVASRPISTAVRAEVGLGYAAPRWPIEAQLSYRFEEIGFSEGVDLRFGGVMVGVGVIFGRRGSR